MGAYYYTTMSQLTTTKTTELTNSTESTLSIPPSLHDEDKTRVARKILNRLKELNFDSSNSTVKYFENRLNN